MQIMLVFSNLILKVLQLEMVARIGNMTQHLVGLKWDTGILSTQTVYAMSF